MSNTHLELKYIYGGIVQYRAGQFLKPRILPDYELVLILEGNVTYVLNGEPHHAPSGSLILARPGFKEEYVWDKASTTLHGFLHFDIQAFPSDWPEPSEWPVICQSPVALIPPLFRHLTERAASHTQWPNTLPDPDTCRLVENLITLHLRPVPSPTAASSTFPNAIYASINAMREILEHDPLQPLQLQDLGARANVSDKHLCRLFQQYIGFPPMKTFRLMKLQLAMAILSRSSLSIQEVARRCGFENPLYFSRTFRKIYGISPSEARSLLLKKTPPPANPLPPDIIPRFYW